MEEPEGAKTWTRVWVWASSDEEDEDADKEEGSDEDEPPLSPGPGTLLHSGDIVTDPAERSQRAGAGALLVDVGSRRAGPDRTGHKWTSGIPGVGERGSGAPRRGHS